MAGLSWRALGTRVDLLVDEGDIDAAGQAVAAVLAEVDQACSRFRTDSELTALNAAAGRPTRVSALLFRAISAALVAAEQTAGLVDPTIGRSMRLVGYDLDFSQVADLPAAAAPIRFESVAGWRVVDLDRRARTVRVPAGVELDLGSTGKALAADLAVLAAIDAAGPGGALVSLGGDIAVAGRAPEGGWPILVAENSEVPADGCGQVIALHDGAVATSSTTVRRWLRAGRPVHHLLDPRTGRPAEGRWRTASVVAATCLDANTVATAAIVGGAAANDWLTGLGVAARLVTADGSLETVGLWPALAPGVAA
jgi:thiamine biosynthesis lipoprotein ApbE